MTPSQIEQLPIKIQKLVRQLEYEVLSDIVRRISINKEITRSADYQIERLYALGISKEFIKDKLTEFLENSAIEIDTLYDTIISEEYTRNRELYSQVGKDFIPYEDNAYLKQLVSAYSSHTKESLENITNTLGFVDSKGNVVNLTEYYRQTLDNANFKIMSGAFDYNRVLRDSVKEMVKSGVRTIDYKNGKCDSVEVAV